MLVPLAHADQPRRADEEVDLLEVGAVGDEEGVRRVLLELGALMVGAHVLDGQGVQPELLLQHGQVLLGGIVGVDPEQTAVGDHLGDR